MITQEEKQLLLNDLCGRLLNEVKGVVYAENTNGEYDLNGEMIFFDTAFDVILDAINTSTEEIHVVAIGNEDTVEFIECQQTDGKPYTIEEFKPYLRPLSSMTEEEYNSISWEGCNHVINYSVKHGFQFIEITSFTIEILNWLNANHFDYHGLIPMGLALEATKDMYKTK